MKDSIPKPTKSKTRGIQCTVDAVRLQLESHKKSTEDLH